MKCFYSLIFSCALFFYGDLSAMKKSSLVLTISPWPPLLWITQQHKSSLAQQLRKHDISVAAFIRAQLESARKDVFKTIGKTMGLTEGDVKQIRSVTGLVKEYDARAAQRSFLYRKDDYQEDMLEHFAGIQELVKTFKVDTDFNIYYDKEFHLDTYYTRYLKDIIVTVDGTLVLAQPENNEYVSRPELIIGPLFFQLNEDEQWGSLARQVAGHIAFEHATERYFLNEVLKKRKVPADKARTTLSRVQELHELEADLIPASHSTTFARYVLSWLQLQKHVESAPYLKERILNVKAVLDLHGAYEAVENKKY